MKYVDEYRDGALVARLAAAIRAAAPPERTFRFMEVCGTHTMALGRFGLRALLPANVKLLSGPGCPVCVTPKEYVDRALALAAQEDVTVATFGDMMRVPGSRGDLRRAAAAGADVRVVYSSMEAVEAAAANPARRVVFLGVGFETTAPTIAAAARAARARGLDNFFVLVAHKLIPPAMRILCANERLALDGFLCPAHVSAIIGTRAYEFIPREHGRACAVAGFEPVDIMQGILMLVRQTAAGKPAVENAYSRVVHPDGNPHALALLAEVFEVADSRWRGLGDIAASGLRLRDAFAPFDAAALPAEVPATLPDEGCLCGDVLSGIIEPDACPLFGRTCTPETPVGPCMVSGEGTCAAAYKYGI